MNAVEFINAEKANYNITLLCNVVGISTSRYYELRKGAVSAQAASDADVSQLIKEIFEEGRGHYGSPRIHDELQKRGLHIGRKRVIRLMQELGLRAKTQRKFKVTTDSKHNGPIAPNILGRRFHVAAPNVVWVSDITYLRTRQGWLYLATIIDLYSRRVVGWALSSRMKARLLCDAFDMAVRSRRPAPGLIFHSDRGSQYASGSFRRRLARYKMRQSMSRKGDCWDNAVAESFFATLKKELVRGCIFSSHDQARSAIFEYIEVFYNRQRKHSTTQGVSPSQFEACNLEQQAA